MSTLTDAREYVGGLSNASKMPCFSYGLPAQKCNVGGKLRKIEGSTCFDCYAYDRGMYVMPNVKTAQERRLAAISRPDWVRQMAIALGNKPFFRWHDSGDIQSEKHLNDIIEVVKLTPHIQHWLPTREAGLVAKLKEIPDNLTIRVSAAMVDGPRPKRFANTSTVHKKLIPINSHICPAPKQEGKCGDCRACWDSAVPNVSYHQH